MSEAATAVFEPKGKVKLIVDAMRAQPKREWTRHEAAEVMECDPAHVPAYMKSVISKGLVFQRGSERGGQTYTFVPPDSAAAAPPPALAIPTFRNFVPAPMQCVRPSAGQIMAAGDSHLAPSNGDDSGKRTTSAATARSHGIPDSASTPEPVEAAGPGQERHEDEDQQPAGSGERRIEVANEGDARVASGGSAQEAEVDEEVQEFDFCRWRDGTLQVWGIAPNDDGSFSIAPEQMAEIRKAIAWSPA